MLKGCKFAINPYLEVANEYNNLEVGFSTISCTHLSIYTSTLNKSSLYTHIVLPYYFEIHILPDDSAASSRRNNLSYPNARPIELKEIIKATGNFQPAMLIGEGIMCQAFKAWLDELTLIALKPGTGMAVTVKTWCNYLERHQDWLVRLSFQNHFLGYNFLSMC